MHVVMITPAGLGGHVLYSHELLCAMAAQAGRQVRLSLVANEDLDPVFQKAAYEAFPILPRLKPLEAFRTRAQWALDRLLHYQRRDRALLRWVEHQSDVAICHYQLAPLIPPLHYRRIKALGASVVATVHNVKPHRYRKLAPRFLVDDFAHRGWRNCDALYVHSNGLRAALQAELGSRFPPILVAPHGSWSVARSQQWTSNAMKLESRTLLLFGVQRRNKGFHVALDALRTLPGYRLVIAGAVEDESLSAEIKARVSADQLPVEVIDGYVPDERVEQLFKQASVAVLPYTAFHAESGALHLATSYGVPVVVSDVGALGESTRRDGVGLVVPPESAEALAEAIRAVTDPERYAAARRACEAVANRGWTEAARATLDGYHMVRSHRVR